MYKRILVPLDGSRTSQLGLGEGDAEATQGIEALRDRWRATLE